jgi:hypothetical protein
MIYAEMTDREKRLSQQSICPICQKSIDKIEDVQLVKMRYGRRVIPFYIHSSCLLNSIASSQLGGIENEEKEYTEQKA